MLAKGRPRRNPRNRTTAPRKTRNWSGSSPELMNVVCMTWVSGRGSGERDRRETARGGSSAPGEAAPRGLPRRGGSAVARRAALEDQKLPAVGRGAELLGEVEELPEVHPDPVAP